MKQIGLVFLLLASGAIVGIYYLWQEATKLPDWYGKTSSPPSAASVQQTTATIQQRIQAQARQSEPSQLNQAAVASSVPSAKAPSAKVPSAKAPSAKVPSSNVEVQVDQAELNDLLAAKIAPPNQSNPLSKSVKGFQTKVENETLKTGAIVDIKELQASNLGSQDQALVSKITEHFPALANQQIYIGIVGQPTVKDGQLHFDENTKIQLGNLSLTMKEISDRFGIPPEQLQEKLRLKLQLQGLDVKDIQFQDGKATLRGDVKE